MTRYFLVPDSKIENLEEDLKKITDYLITFVGEIEVSFQNKKSATIHYLETQIISTLKIYNNQIELIQDNNDTVSVNLIKNVLKNLGLRIFNPQTLAYSLSDPAILDLTPDNIDPAIERIIKNYGLKPLFNYRESLVFFAEDEGGRIHLINRHLLEFLKENSSAKPVSKNDFSVVVANNIGHFIALFDRGVIPLSYYKCLDSGIRITNLSGLDIENLKRDVLCEVIPFHFNPIHQNFNQGESTMTMVKKGGNLIRNLKLNTFMAVKIQPDVTYGKMGNKLIPNLRLSVFYDS